MAIEGLLMASVERPLSARPNRRRWVVVRQSLNGQKQSLLVTFQLPPKRTVKRQDELLFTGRRLLLATNNADKGATLHCELPANRS